MRFYLRKIEGAEILLSHETNFFRTELHKWMPIAPEPPPVIDSSNSTRKPRPTKQQKLMAQYGVNTPEELPMTLRTKAHTFKKKIGEPNRPAPIKPAPHKGGSHPPSTSMSPVQIHTPTHPIHHPQFDYSSHYAMPGPSQIPPQYAQSSSHVSPSHMSPTHMSPTHMSPSHISTSHMSPSQMHMNPLRGGPSMDPMLMGPYHSHGSGLGSSSREHYSARDARDLNHMFETLTNQDADNLYTREPASSTTSNSSSAPVSASAGGLSSSSSVPPPSFAEQAAAALQLSGDAIDPFLTDTILKD